MGRLSRGWEMTKLSFKIIGMNKSLMLFPVISGIIIMMIISTFIIGFWFFPQMAEMPTWLWVIVGFLLYIIMFFISYFFQAALVACAYETMDGKQPTLGFGISKAKARAFEIFKWAIISAIIGMILRAVESRFPLASRFIGVAWSIGTYFVVPIIVFEGNGAWPSVKQSWQVLKNSWGETLVGNIAMGLIFFVLALPVILFFVLAGAVENVYMFGILIIAAVVYLVFIAILSNTVSTVMQTALYRYVKTGQIGVTLPSWLPPPQGQPGAPQQAYPVYDQQPQPPPSY